MNTTLNTDPAKRGVSGDAEGVSVRGLLTGVSLADVRRLRLPPTIDPFGRLRPPLDHTALDMSLELAYMTYTLALEPWMRAGWTDISIQVDNHLQSGVTVGESESVTNERIRNLMNSWKVARARMAMRELNPVAQLMGALRQREKSDTIKAVTMIHPAGNGRYVVAIGFMGTGSRFYDWFSNFKMMTEDGFHKGFYQLTQVFEQSAPKIRFPDTAAALGLEKLTLTDILTEMRAPDSRFSLWMAGHSQGAAVMQVFCHRLLTAWQIPMRHVVGYGFASPTTSVGDPGRDAAAYPLYHILNSDDLVPRIGALMHLGMGLSYVADEELRQAAYGWEQDETGAQLRADAETLFAHIVDTPTMLEAMVALLTTIHEEKTEESLNALMDKRWSVLPLDKAFAFAGGKMKDTIVRMVRYGKVAYYTLTGIRMNEEVVAALMVDMGRIVRAYPLMKLLTALRDRFHPPHMLRRPHEQVGAYGYISTMGSARLLPFIWQGMPKLHARQITTGQSAVFTPAAGHGQATVCTVSIKRRAAIRHNPRDRSVSAKRARHSVRVACTLHRERRRVRRIQAMQPHVAPARRARRGKRR